MLRQPPFIRCTSLLLVAISQPLCRSVLQPLLRRTASIGTLCMPANKLHHISALFVCTKRAGPIPIRQIGQPLRHDLLTAPTQTANQAFPTRSTNIPTLQRTWNANLHAAGRYGFACFSSGHPGPSHTAVHTVVHETGAPENDRLGLSKPARSFAARISLLATVCSTTVQSLSAVFANVARHVLTSGGWFQGTSSY